MRRIYRPSDLGYEVVKLCTDLIFKSYDCDHTDCLRQAEYIVMLPSDEPDVCDFMPVCNEHLKRVDEKHPAIDLSYIKDGYEGLI